MSRFQWPLSLFSLTAHQPYIRIDCYTLAELRIAYFQEPKIFDPNLLYVQSSHLPASGKCSLRSPLYWLNFRVGWRCSALPSRSLLPFLGTEECSPGGLLTVDKAACKEIHQLPRKDLDKEVNLPGIWNLVTMMLNISIFQKDFLLFIQVFKIMMIHPILYNYKAVHYLSMRRQIMRMWPPGPGKSDDRWWLSRVSGFGLWIFSSPPDQCSRWLSQSILVAITEHHRLGNL